MTTQEGNKLIAEFMGCKLYEDAPVMKVWLRDPHDDGTLFYCEWHPQYAKGTKQLAWVFEPEKIWCQLMPVVEKISKIEIADQFPRIEIVPSGYVKIENLRDTPIFTNVSIEGSLITAIWKAVVQFIQWYNKTQQP